MPRRTDLSSILVIGAGPIVIGQACEFDYSGTQAVKALKAEGYRVVLVNSNPATIMTDPGLADATYVEPVSPEVVARVIERERPDAVLPTMGGQTALNTARALATTGVLDRFGTELIGATLDAIDKAEDREQFRDAMERIGLECARGVAVHSPADARAALDAVGLPAIVRPSFTLGGTGGGIAYNRGQFEDIVRRGLEASPVTEVLVEESVLGWKEFEMEVVRDRADNCIIVCSIENIDPMGVHTGDSITVAPALTLTDKEYQVMRNASFAAIREIGVDTGGSNVQFAIDPADGRMVVIELNPRVSRSSALASKATGFPIAKVAAKLAVGYTLDEIRNDLTKVTPASFEPAIDYVVTKVPRFTFEKFPGTEPLLTTSMKSVGEAMAIGRTFAESLQKALRSMETGLAGLDPVAFDDTSEDGIVARLARPSPDRILVIAQAMRHGFEDGTIHAITRYDPWFLEQLRMIVEAEGEIRANGVPGDDPHALLRLKKLGFSDCRLARLAGARRGGDGDAGDAGDGDAGDGDAGDGVPGTGTQAAGRATTTAGATTTARAEGAGRAPGRTRAPARRTCAPRARARASGRCSSASTPARPSSSPALRISIPATRATVSARPRTRPSRATRRRSSSSGAGRTASARASSSTIAASMRARGFGRPASRRSWSTATRRRSRPTTTRPTGSTSSR